MKRLLAITALAILCFAGAAPAADAPEPSAKVVALLKEKGVLPMVEKAQGFVYLTVRQDLARIEKLYGLSDQMRDTISGQGVTEVLKSVDSNVPMEMDLVAFDMLDAQTCSMLFIVHGSEGPIGIKVYWMPSKNGFVHRVEILWDWEEIETMARRMEKVPQGYSVTVTKTPE